MANPLLLGLEIGGTKLQVGLGLDDGGLLALERLAVEPRRGAEGILKQIEAAVPPLLRSFGQGPSAVAAVGVGFGGPVDPATGVVVTSHQISGWAGFRLSDWLRSVLGVRITAVENDADTAALGEARFGAGLGVGSAPILYVQVGSGIGGGLIVDGRPYRGAGPGAIEIGHLWMDRADRIGDTHRTLEQVASGWAIADAARHAVEREFQEGWPPGALFALAGGDPDRITAETVAQAARQGDPDASRILDAAALAVAAALAHAATLLAPGRIILGGGVSLIGETHWLGPIRREVDRRVFPPLRGTFDLVGSELGESVVVQGALALARDAWVALGRPGVGVGPFEDLGSWFSSGGGNRWS